MLANFLNMRNIIVQRWIDNFFSRVIILKFRYSIPCLLIRFIHIRLNILLNVWIILLSISLYALQLRTCSKCPCFHDKNTYISLTIIFFWHAFHLFSVVLLFSRFSFHVSGFDLEFSRKTRILKNIVTKSLLTCCNMALLLKLTLAGFNIGVWEKL